MDRLGYERPDPGDLFGDVRATELFGARAFCRFCERVHRPAWLFADCANLQSQALGRALTERQG